MALNLHPADLSDIKKIGTATHFNVHLRIGPAEKIDRKAKTLAAAVRIADELGLTPGGRKPLIYAVTPDRMTVHVSAAMIAQARQEIEQKAAADHKRARAGVEALARANASMVDTWPSTFGKAATAPHRAASKGKARDP